jgi:Cu/Zn superoxide dismutase
MKIIRLVLACAGLCAAFAAPAWAATDSLTLTLNAQNGSGENGTATLTQVNGDVKVVIAIPHGPAGPQPAHIHTGTCAKLGGVAYPLTSAVSGVSMTLVKGITIDQLLAGKYAINVHKSADDLGDYVACANVTPSSSM